MRRGKKIYVTPKQLDAIAAAADTMSSLSEGSSDDSIASRLARQSDLLFTVVNNYTKANYGK